MSDTSAFGFGQFVPGFDFLQNLSKTAAQAQPAAAAGMPGMASWVAPTLSIEDIDKRIQELKSVLFWLEQNTTALKATIQAMEVQKMTLTVLQSMNVNMADLGRAFTAKPPSAETVFASAASESVTSAAFEPAPPQPPSAANAAQETAAAKPVVDPMLWWSALTQQFQGIATAALKDVAAEALKAGVSAQASGKSARKAPVKSSVKATVKTGPVPRKAAAK
jgi:hypothetical protein